MPTGQENVFKGKGAPDVEATSQNNDVPGRNDTPGSKITGSDLHRHLLTTAPPENAHYSSDNMDLLAQLVNRASLATSSQTEGKGASGVESTSQNNDVPGRNDAPGSISIMALMVDRSNPARSEWRERAENRQKEETNKRVTNVEHAVEHLHNMLKVRDLHKSILQNNAQPSFYDLYQAAFLGDQVKHRQGQYKDKQLTNVKSLFSAIDIDIQYAERNLMGVKSGKDQDQRLTSTQEKVERVKSQVAQIKQSRTELSTFETNFDRERKNVMDMALQRVSEKIMREPNELPGKIASLREGTDAYKQKVDNLREIYEGWHDEMFDPNTDTPKIPDDVPDKEYKLIQELKEEGERVSQTYEEMAGEMILVLHFYDKKTDGTPHKVHTEYQVYKEEILPIGQSLRKNEAEVNRIAEGFKHLVNSIGTKQRPPQDDLLR